MDGFSIGGGSLLGNAILAHDFDGPQSRAVRYLAISRNTFSSLSTVAVSFVGVFAKCLFYLVGFELDALAGAKQLSARGIEHIIIQSNQDEVIAKTASLAYGITREKMGGKIIVPYDGTHCTSLGREEQHLVNAKITEFFKKN